MSDPKLDQFLALVEHGHYGRAAEALGLSQQAVSKSVAALEKQYGVKLFTRGPFGATPTSFGEVLATRARVARAEMVLAQSEIDALRGSRHGQVRIGVGLCFAGRIVPQSIARFRKRYPKVHITAIVESSAALFPMLLAGALDFCVSAPPPDFPIDPDLSREHLFVDRDTVIVRRQHPLARRSRVKLADLAEHTWLMSAQIADVWKRVCHEFTAAGIAAPTQLVRTDSIALARELVLGGDYIVLLSRENIVRELDHGDVVSIDIERIPQERPAILTCRQRSTLSPAAANLARIIREVCFEHHGAPAPRR